MSKVYLAADARLNQRDIFKLRRMMASFVYHTAMRDEKLPRKPLPKAQS